MPLVLPRSVPSWKIRAVKLKINPNCMITLIVEDKLTSLTRSVYFIIRVKSVILLYILATWFILT